MEGGGLLGQGLLASQESSGTVVSAPGRQGAGKQRGKTAQREVAGGLVGGGGDLDLQR